MSATNKPSSAQQKMDAWHKGERKQNVKSCSDEKLQEYLKICTDSGYTYEATILQHEIYLRFQSRANEAYLIYNNNDLRYLKKKLIGAKIHNTGVIIDENNIDKIVEHSESDIIIELAAGVILTESDRNKISNATSGNEDLFPADLGSECMILYDDWDKQGEGIECNVPWKTEPEYALLKDVIDNLTTTGKNVHLFFLTDD